MSAVGEPPVGGFRDEIRAGAAAGVARLARTGVQLPVGLDAIGLESAPLSEPFLIVSELFATRNIQPRFAELFSELVTVAAVARTSYDEPRLQRVEIEEFLEHTMMIVNSFGHA
jgi:hypothetical protein